MTFKLKNLDDVKFYLYISKAKLQMLFRQIGRAEGTKQSIEWKATGLLGSVVRKVESEESVVM
jgi:hypothetical protein